MKNKKLLLLLLPMILLGCNKTAGRKKVIILGVDGAGAFFSEEHTPNVYRIFNNEHSATTHTCLTSNPTISAQCWGSMLTGVTPEVHKFTNDIISKHRNTEHPSIFYQARKQLPQSKLASIVNWAPINYGIIEEGIDVHKEAFENGETDEPVYKRVCEYVIQETPDLLYVQFDSVDHYGHTYGYKSNEYYSQLKLVDSYIGVIHDKLNDKGLLSQYDFIVDADHGGYLKDHGGYTEDERLIFFGITGENIKKSSITNMKVRDIPAICARAMRINLNYQWDSNYPDIFE